MEFEIRSVVTNGNAYDSTATISILDGKDELINDINTRIIYKCTYIQDKRISHIEAELKPGIWIELPLDLFDTDKLEEIEYQAMLG